MLKSGENGLIGPGSNNYGRDTLDDCGELMFSQRDIKGFFSRRDHGKIPSDILLNELKRANENMKNDFPRRAKLYECFPAELAITTAVGEIEKIGYDVRLTEAQILLNKARDLVSDYIDEKLKSTI